MNGKKVGGIIPRLNFQGSNENWLSLKPLSASNYTDSIHFGELNSRFNLHGRGLKIFTYGNIWIGYFDDGVLAPGNYLYIFGDGNVKVGQVYLKDGKK